jgi:hypothetical protein
VVDGLADVSLDGQTTPGWPEPGSYPVRECLPCIFCEEWEDGPYAERDLDAFEARLVTFCAHDPRVAASS